MFLYILFTAEKDFALHDSAGENKYGVNLMESLRRAKELGGKLLAGQTFYVTPKTNVDTKLLKSVVTACGGQVSFLYHRSFFFFFAYFSR
jgi:mediator of DNA damage checkpoint protein 1